MPISSEGESVRLEDKSLSELKEICRACTLPDECGECRLHLYQERAEMCVGPEIFNHWD